MRVLSVSSDFSIKGVMEFCKCFRLSALYFCTMFRETKCLGNSVLFPHLLRLWRTGAVLTFLHLKVVCSELGGANSAQVGTSHFFFFWLCDFPKLVNLISLGFSNLYIWDKDNFYHGAALEWAGLCWMANIFSKSSAWVAVNKSSLHTSLDSLSALSSHWLKDAGFRSPLKLQAMHKNVAPWTQQGSEFLER